jgi:hypothetical protein
MKYLSHEMPQIPILRQKLQPTALPLFRLVQDFVGFLVVHLFALFFSAKLKNK